MEHYLTDSKNATLPSAVIDGRRRLAEKFDVDPERKFCMDITTPHDFACVLGWPFEWARTVGQRFRFVTCARYACYRTPIIERVIWVPSP